MNKDGVMVREEGIQMWGKVHHMALCDVKMVR